MNVRANIGNLVAGAGGVLLFIFLFADWYGPSAALGAVVGGGHGASAWKFFTIVDVVLCALAVATVAFAAILTFAVAPGARWLQPRLLTTLGTVAVTLTLMFGWEISSGSLGKIFDSKAGAWLSFLASLLILAGGIIAERPQLARRLEAAAQGLGTGPSPPAAGTAAPPAPPQSPGTASEAPTTRVATPPSAPPAASSAEAQSGGPPAGWYPDPQGQARLRYWDGGRWTSQTSA